MANTDKKQIQDHLAKTSGGNSDYTSAAKNYSESQSSSKEKQSKQEHIERSLGNYNLNSSNKQSQKGKVMDHLRATKGE